MNIQIIEHDGAPEYAIVPFREWETIIDSMEELEDIRDARTISAAIAAGEETYPHEFVKRLSSCKMMHSAPADQAFAGAFFMY